MYGDRFVDRMGFDLINKIVTSLIIVTFFLPFTSVAKIIEEKPTKIVDGDTINFKSFNKGAFIKERVRLLGMDAPEKDQLCNIDSSCISCGNESTSALKAIIKNNNVRCEWERRDKYGRILADCYVIGASTINLAEAMVRQGYAFVNPRYSQRYKAAQDEAQRNNVGLWKYEFIEPWTFRRFKKQPLACK